MDIKKSLIFLSCIIVLSSLVIAQEYKMEMSTIPEDKIFGVEETIQMKITLYDLNSNLINDEVSVIIEDIKGTKIKEATIQSNKFEKIVMGEGISGEGKIIVRYKDSEITEPFFIKEKELAKFEINDGVLKITNIGNTKYNRKVYIIIGKTTGVKNPEIGIGKSVTYRLVAPKGVYKIKISDDGVSQSLEEGEVRLTGTGKAIGALDEQTSRRNPLTGGISPDKNSDQALLNYIRDSKFTYAFVLVIFGAMILLAIERRYRKKIKVN